MSANGLVLLLTGYVFRVSAIFAAHFLMSLRDVSQRHDALTDSKALTLTTLFFTLNFGTEREQGTPYPISDVELSWEIASGSQGSDLPSRQDC